jgi:hypothetical protein
VSGKEGWQAHLHRMKMPSLAYCWFSVIFSMLPSSSRTEACTCTETQAMHEAAARAQQASLPPHEKLPQHSMQVLRMSLHTIPLVPTCIWNISHRACLILQALTYILLCGGSDAAPHHKWRKNVQAPQKLPCVQQNRYPPRPPCC